jgi:hypothetical protein
MFMSPTLEITQSACSGRFTREIRDDERTGYDPLSVAALMAHVLASLGTHLNAKDHWPGAPKARNEFLKLLLT